MNSCGQVVIVALGMPIAAPCSLPYDPISPRRPALTADGAQWRIVAVPKTRN
jgi:hypothetical protein